MFSPIQSFFPFDFQIVIFFMMAALVCFCAGLPTQDGRPGLNEAIPIVEPDAAGKAPLIYHASLRDRISILRNAPEPNAAPDDSSADNASSRSSNVLRNARVRIAARDNPDDASLRNSLHVRQNARVRNAAREDSSADNDSLRNSLQFLRNARVRIAARDEPSIDDASSSNIGQHLTIVAEKFVYD